MQDPKSFGYVLGGSWVVGLHPSPNFWHRLALLFKGLGFRCLGFRDLEFKRLGFRDLGFRPIIRTTIFLGLCWSPPI